MSLDMFPDKAIERLIADIERAPEYAECICDKCSEVIKVTDYTYPECPMCYIDGKCC